MRGRSARAVELPESVVAVGRARIQYGVPLAYVMRTFRLSQDLLWAWLFARITDRVWTPPTRRWRWNW